MSLFISIVCALTFGQVAKPATMPWLASTAPMKPPVVSGNQKQRKLIGSLGRVSLDTAIYAAPDIGSRVFYQTKRSDYLVLNDSPSGEWHKVLLKNNQWGFIQANSAVKLPYQVFSNPLPPVKGANPRSLAADKAMALTGPSELVGSQFVRKAFGAVGLKLPEKISQQAKFGRRVARLEHLKKGDRVYFWSEEKERIDQTGIYLGNGYMVYLDEASGEVGTAYLGDKKWLKALVAARR